MIINEINLPVAVELDVAVAHDAALAEHDAGLEQAETK